MSTRKPTPRNRAVRPAAEDLEGRHLLSATVSGTDIDGDLWTLRLIGPGALTVVKQNDASGNPAPLNSATEINQIIIGGLDPTKSRLVGRIHKAATGDGKVFFQTLTELPSKSERLPAGNGPLAVDMPQFWLGKTTPTTSTTTTTTTPSIAIPDGTSTLRFGGVDTTHNQVSPPPSGATSDAYTVTLGLPEFGGTRIIIDRSISSSQTSTSTTTPTPTPTVIQHAVTFAVAGRLNLFQANAIQGDAQTPPGQFQSTENPTATGFGGTWVFSGTAGTAPFLTTTGTPQTPFSVIRNIQGAGTTGAIGDVRVGGNATNLTVAVTDATGTGQAKLANFSVGGETDNILVVAPNGARNLVFGLGMDKVEILTHVIDYLKANRGALNSTVVSDRSIGKVVFGGDVVNTVVQSGYTQNFANILNNAIGAAAVSSFQPTLQPTPPPTPETDPSVSAQTDSGMTVLVAGDVTDSIFASAVQPFFAPGATTPQGVFGTPNDLVLPLGHIAAKVEGTINNSTVTPNMPTKAFYAKQLHVHVGPVIPPNVPEPPYPGPQRPFRAPGIPNLNGASARFGTRTRLRTAVPRGPGNASQSQA